MSTETEVKIRIDDPDNFCAAIGALNPEILSARHFEDNVLMDFPDQKLKNSQCLLRVRFVGDNGLLTYKGPPRPEGIFKTREELETRLENGPAMVRILEQVGMSVCFRYQKYRREYLLNGVHIAVDETPIGDYVELEGSEEGILGLARALGLPETDFLRSSYYSLYLDHCRKEGVKPHFMIFQEA